MNLQIIKILVLGLLILGNLGGTLFAEEIFPTPDNLKDNVAFWKKIYTEVSLQEGILHDREYPLIIYEKLVIGKREGRSRRQFVKYHKDVIIQMLKNLVKKSPSQLTAKEQEILELFKQHASTAEIKSAPERLRFQLGQRERFKEGLERSGAYLTFIRLMFKIYEIPARIIYLPHVESSFNINAYSRVGAAGMWQFMQGTARVYRLKIDYRIDERRDPIKSTIAAARLLKENYEELKSWPLAITAYNHGLVSIKRAVKETGSRDIGKIIDEYQNRRFKFASKNFYSCFLAASHIAANAKKYFPDLQYHPPLQYQEIQLESYLKPKTLASQLGVSLEQLKELNPALRSIVFSRQLPIPKGYKLRIPAVITPVAAKEKLAAIPASVNQSDSKSPLYYTVFRGDTLSSISRRFRVSLDSLLVANEISSKHHIYIGQVLRIPGKGEAGEVSEPNETAAVIDTSASTSTSTSTTGISNTGTSTSSPAVKTTPPPVTPTVPPKTTESPGIDTKPKTGPVEQNITAVEKPKGSIPDEAFNAELYNLEVNLLQGNQYAIITVSAEESLGHYSDWLNTSVRKLRTLNQGIHSLQVNQKLKIPLPDQLSSLERFKARRLEYHMALEEDFYSQYKVVETKERKVGYGDTLWSICKRDEIIPIWLLAKYNRDIDLGKLKANATLTIPVIAPKSQGSN